MRALLVLLALALPAAAQELVTVRVTSNAPQGGFRVDGAYYTGTAAFVWPAASKHTLEVDAVQSGPSLGVRYTFQNWQTAAGPLASSSRIISITADPLLPVFEARFVIEYDLSIRFNPCDAGAVCPSPGTVWVNNGAYTQDTEYWAVAGSQVRLEAAANPGFVFVGWAYREGLAFLHTLVATQPMTITARFSPARPVTLRTEPEGLQVVADRLPVNTPTTLDWGFDTVHTLGVISPQRDLTGNPWIFKEWSDGGEAIHAYRVSSVNGPVSVTARYVPGAVLSFLTSPAGLALKVDGVESRPPYNFTWAFGEQHTVSAPARQVDSRGVPYVFRGWSDGGDATHAITVEGALRLTATYEALGVVTLDTSPLSVPLEVDGTACASPCRLERAMGEKVRVTAASTSPVDEDARFDFTGWSDGGARQREITLGEPRTLTAAYRAMCRFKAVADPADGASFTVLPSSADGYHPAGTEITVAATALSGYRFRRWETGESNPARLTLDVPRTLLARLDEIPYIAPAGVRNAAPGAPEGPVAPGSLISISGKHLATEIAIGPDAPLAQTLAGVTVAFGERILPLLMVSPEAITAQLPNALEPGRYKLVVRGPAGPDVSADVEVVANAPGLFEPPAHADGSPVTAEAPAKPGEPLTFYGTGLGAYERTPLDGFPAAAPFALLDVVEAATADEWVAVTEARASTDRVGLTVLRIPAPAATAKVRIRVNGRESNAVLVPVQ